MINMVAYGFLLMLILSLLVMPGEFVTNYQSARVSLCYFYEFLLSQCSCDEHLCDIVIILRQQALCFVYFSSKTCGE